MRVFLEKKFEEAALAAKGDPFYMQLSEDEKDKLEGAYKDFFSFRSSSRISLFSGYLWYEIVPQI